jgi:hypothetical protein
MAVNSWLQTVLGEQQAVVQYAVCTIVTLLFFGRDAEAACMCTRDEAAERRSAYRWCACLGRGWQCLALLQVVHKTQHLLSFQMFACTLFDITCRWR